MEVTVNTLESNQESFEKDTEAHIEIFFKNHHRIIREHTFCGEEIWTKEISYNENGSRDGFTKTYINGILVMLIPYNRGMRNGLAQIFNREGILEKEIPYIRSMKHGIQKEYNWNTNLIIETPFARGKRQGVKKWLNAEGRVVKKIRYDNDRIDHTYKYEYCPYEDDTFI
jgi:antitoxin component YwqK of YwqJK toxin-antitoxin module